jgi:hypothetical protein
MDAEEASECRRKGRCCHLDIFRNSGAQHLIGIFHLKKSTNLKKKMD